MLAIERRNAIARLVHEQGSVTLCELTALFDVSSETVRKDLLALEKDQRLVRTHGGAVRVARREALAPLRERRKDCVAQKRELCRYALRFIRNGDVIALDEGSTGAELARLIACTFTNLTIATSSLEIFNILSENPGFDLILCGGHFIRDELAFAGTLTLSLIQRLHFDKCCIFPSAVSLEWGLMDSRDDLIAVQQALIHHSDAVYVLAYSERFEQTARIQVDEMRPTYTYITDSALPEEIYTRYLDHQIQIIKE